MRWIFDLALYPVGFTRREGGECMNTSPFICAFEQENIAVPGAGGVLENVFIRNVRIGRVSEAVLTIDQLYAKGAEGPFQPVVRNIQFDRVTSSGNPRVLYLRGFPGAIIDDIRSARSTFDNVTETEVVQLAGTIILDDATLNPARATGRLNSVPAKK